jgi:hypothetical protein
LEVRWVLPRCTGFTKVAGEPGFVADNQLFALGEGPTAEQLAAWLPDRWHLDRAKKSSEAPAATG